MKTIKMHNYGNMFEIHKFERYKITERDIGKLGNKCSFLVEIFSAFKSKVNIFK